MSRIRWGVIGSGGIASRRTIPEGLAPASNAQLVSVYDVDPERNREVARKYGAAAAESLEQLLASGVDAVYIATPAACHYAQALAAIGAGKHVFCEKPLGLNVAEAEGIVSAAASAGVKLGTAFMMRYHALHREAGRLIAEGRLGKVVYARAQLSCWYPPMEGAWRQDPAAGGGGSLIDMGGHCIDVLESLLGPVNEVACMIRRSVHGYASEDSAVAMLSFAGGALATVDTFFCIPDESSLNMLEIFGSAGSLIASGTIGQGPGGTMVARFQNAAGYDAAQARSGNQAVEIKAEPVNTYRAEIEDFSQALLDGREPMASGEAGLRSQRILAACYDSARTGSFVRLL